MANEQNAGQLRVPVVMDLGPLQRDARTRLRRQANEIGRQSADDILKGANRRFEQRTADAKSAFAEKLIDKRQLRQQTREAMDAFDAEITRGIRRSGQHLSQADFSKLGNALKNAGAKGAEGFQSEMSQLPQWIRGGFAGLVVGSMLIVANRVAAIATRMMRGIVNAVEQGGKTIEARESFDTLTASRGMNAQGLLGAARTGSRGTVNDLALMQRVNFALQAQLPVTEKQIVTLSEAARRLARVVGGDATDAFKRLVEGIGKGEVEILEELGVIVRVEDALKAWERQTGKNSDSLNELEKKAIFLNAVMADLERQMVTLGEDRISPRERLAQVSAALTNLKDSALAAITESPKIASFLDSIGANAESSANRVQYLADTIGALADVVLDKASGPGIGRTVLGAFLSGTTTGRVIRDAGRIGSGILHSGAVTSARNSRAMSREGSESIQAIGAERDINVLLERRVKLQESLMRLGEGQTEESEAVNLLLAQQEAIERRITALRVKKPEGPPLPTTEERRAAEAEEKRLRELLKNFNDKQLSDYQLQVRALDELAAAAKRFNDAGASKEIARQRQELVKQQQVMESIARGDIPKWLIQRARMRGKPADMGAGGSNPMDPGADITAIQTALKNQVATLRIAKEAGTITEKQWKEQVAQAITEANRKLLTLLKTFEIMGIVAPEVVQQIADALGDVDKDTAKTAKKVEDLAEAFVAVARGVLAVADAMGALKDGERQALEGAINLAEGISQIAKGNVIGGAMQTAGALFQIGQGLFGESEADKARKELLKQNNDELQRMRLEIAGWRADSAQARTQTERFIAAVRGGQSIGGAFSSTGFTKLQLDAVAQAYGIQVLDENGKVSKEALQQLLTAMNQAAANGGLGASADGSARLSVNITEMQANQLLDFAATSVDHLAAIRKAVTGSDLISPPITAPSLGGGMAGGSLVIESITVEAGGAGMTSREDARAMGEAVGRGLLETVSDAHRGMGIKGPHRFEIVKRGG